MIDKKMFLKTVAVATNEARVTAAAAPCWTPWRRLWRRAELGQSRRPPTAQTDYEKTKKKKS